MQIHPDITPDKIAAAVERYQSSLENPGFCISCGAEHDYCEPDMRNGECECCGENAVYGAEELFFSTGLAG